MTKGMRKYFRKKIFWFVITLIAAVILNFILPRLMPGDPVNAIVGKNISPGATPEQIQELNEMEISGFDARVKIRVPLAEDLRLSAADIKALEPFVEFEEV